MNMKLKVSIKPFMLSLLCVGVFFTPLSASATPCIDSSRDQLLAKSKPFDKIISKAARTYRVDAHLIRAVIAIESCYNPHAVSPAGARGLMQIMPATGERFGANNVDKPSDNINVGARYLHFLQQRYPGQLDKVLAAYNAGEGKVEQYQAIPPYRETQEYVANVIRTYKKLSSVPKPKPNPRKIWGKPGRQGIAALKLKAPHLFKQGTENLQTVEAQNHLSKVLPGDNETTLPLHPGILDTD